MAIQESQTDVLVGLSSFGKKQCRLTQLEVTGIQSVKVEYAGYMQEHSSRPSYHYESRQASYITASPDLQVALEAAAVF